MCGITGFVDFNSAIEYSQKQVIEEMIHTLNHRGPDDKGSDVFEIHNSSIALAQARLSIIDLSSAGHQPMHYKRWSIVFNGEIYNYKELKEELLDLNHQFNSDSDTEVILHAYEEWGVTAIKKFIGMFAIILFDQVENKIILIRDRTGIKPLYYYENENIFLFASELKAFHKHPKFKKEIDPASLVQYFENIHHGYIAAPKTIFKNTLKLLPGCILTIDLASRKTNIEKYWNIIDFFKLPKATLSYAESKLQLKELLTSACQYRMISDVPIGVFLSGGYDSTLVTSILQTNRQEKLKTFTIAFEEGNNEGPYAKQTAAYLGTDHTEYYCTTKEAQEIISTLPFFYDEPFADSSAIPTILVSKLAQKEVTVVLSADGGDEIFAGYTSYSKLYSYLKYLGYIPRFLKPTVSSLGLMLLKIIPVFKNNSRQKFEAFVNSMNKNKWKETRNLFTAINTFPSHYTSKIFKSNLKVKTVEASDEILSIKNNLEIPLIIDYESYLQNDILTKVDRATMSVSIEGREPLLDHRIAEFAAQLPFSYKWQNGVGKRILKDIVHDYVPKEMMDRPKTGFSLPIYDWLRGDLSYLIDEHLSLTALKKSGLFNETWVAQQVELFKENKLHYQPFIWKLLMFQMWYEKWMK